MGQLVAVHGLWLMFGVLTVLPFQAKPRTFSTMQIYVFPRDTTVSTSWMTFSSSFLSTTFIHPGNLRTHHAVGIQASDNPRTHTTRPCHHLHITCNNKFVFLFFGCSPRDRTDGTCLFFHISPYFNFFFFFLQLSMAVEMDI